MISYWVLCAPACIHLLRMMPGRVCFAARNACVDGACQPRCATSDVQANAPASIEFLSLDTEGSEHAILSSFPFDRQVPPSLLGMK